MEAYEAYPESIHPCNMKNRNIYWRRYKKHCTQDNDILVSFKVGTLGHSSSNCHQLPYYIFLNQWFEISSLLKVILVLGTARSHRAPNLGCKGAESSGWFDVSPKNPARDVMHDQVCCDEAASHQLPIAMAFWVIQTVSTKECSSLR